MTRQFFRFVRNLFLQKYDSRPHFLIGFEIQLKNFVRLDFKEIFLTISEEKFQREKILEKKTKRKKFPKKKPMKKKFPKKLTFFGLEEIAVLVSTFLLRHHCVVNINRIHCDFFYENSYKLLKKIVNWQLSERTASIYFIKKIAIIFLVNEYSTTSYSVSAHCNLNVVM